MKNSADASPSVEFTDSSGLLTRFDALVTGLSCLGPALFHDPDSRNVLQCVHTMQLEVAEFGRSFADRVRAITDYLLVHQSDEKLISQISEMTADDVSLIIALLIEHDASPRNAACALLADIGSLANPALVAALNTEVGDTWKIVESCFDEKDVSPLDRPFVENILASDSPLLCRLGIAAIFAKYPSFEWLTPLLTDLLIEAVISPELRLPVTSVLYNLDQCLKVSEQHICSLVSSPMLTSPCREMMMFKLLSQAPPESLSLFRKILSSDPLEQRLTVAIAASGSVFASEIAEDALSTLTEAMRSPALTKNWNRCVDSIKRYKARGSLRLARSLDSRLDSETLANVFSSSRHGRNNFNQDHVFLVATIDNPVAEVQAAISWNLSRTPRPSITNLPDFLELASAAESAKVREAAVWNIGKTVAGHSASTDGVPRVKGHLKELVRDPDDVIAGVAQYLLDSIASSRSEYVPLPRHSYLLRLDSTAMMTPPDQGDTAGMVRELITQHATSQSAHILDACEKIVQWRSDWKPARSDGSLLCTPEVAPSGIRRSEPAEWLSACGGFTPEWCDPLFSAAALAHWMEDQTKTDDVQRMQILREILSEDILSEEAWSRIAATVIFPRTQMNSGRVSSPSGGHGWYTHESYPLAGTAIQFLERSADPRALQVLWLGTFMGAAERVEAQCSRTLAGRVSEIGPDLAHRIFADGIVIAGMHRGAAYKHGRILEQAVSLLGYWYARTRGERWLF